MIKQWTPMQPVTREGASPAFLEYLSALEREIIALQGKLDAIAAVAAPVGGATIDAEARTAINAIRTAAS